MKQPINSQLLAAWLLIVFSILACCAANCQGQIPLRAYRYRGDLRREAALVWNTDDRSVFAAQIHAESAWRPEARSIYARGLAQFTPATEQDMNAWYPELRDLGDALSPRWAIRALLLYDLRLWQRFTGWQTEDDRWAATLHGYNAGPGWLVKERAASCDRTRYQPVCLRRPEACRETAHYVRRILRELRPLYEGF